MRYRLPLLSLLIVSLLTTSASAQKAPELGYVFPPGVKRGATTSVQLGGYDLTPDTRFFVHERRIQLTVDSSLGDFIVPPPPYWFGERARGTAFPIPREFTGKLSIPADISAGLKRWQVANANGSSTTATFFVSDVDEILEQRIQKRAQKITQLPIGISGRLERIAEVDRYLITAKNDGPMSVELFARRLGANFNGQLAVRDSQGRLIAEKADTEGGDMTVTFAAKKGATYTVALHDISFRGNQAFVYRLAITPGPRVIATIPAMGQRGTTREVELIGYGVATGEARLESARRMITFPAAPAMNSLSHTLPAANGKRCPVDIPLSDLPELAAQDAKGRMVVKAPAAVTTSLRGRARVFSWSAKKGQLWSIAAKSHAFSSPVDPFISIRNAAGKQLASNDDSNGTPDAVLQFKVPVDGIYDCVLRDVSGREPSVTSLCRVEWKIHPPGFALTMPQQINLPTPGKTSLALSVERFGNFQGEIALSIEGLPAGIAVAEDLKIPAGKKTLKVTLSAGPKTASQAALIRVRGTAQIDGTAVSRTATAPAAGNLCPRSDSDKRASHLMLATTLKPRFTLELVDKNRQRPVHRGTTYPAPFLIQRESGFKGQLQIQMAARQGRHRQGIKGPVLTVPQGAQKAFYPCFMPEWLETDRTTRMAVMGVAQQFDPAGKVRYVTKPAGARVTMILEGALLKIAHQARELTVKPGDSFRVPLTVSRSAKLRTTASLNLIVPARLAGLVRLRGKQTIPADRSRTEIEIETTKDPRLAGRWNLILTASAKENGKWPVVSQTGLTVEFATGGPE